MAQYFTTLSFEDEDFKPKWIRRLKTFGGYDPDKKVMNPLRNVAKLLKAEGASGMQYMLDSIAAAYELEPYSDFAVFQERCFASPSELHEFASNTSCYCDFWVNERHFAAFFALVGAEEGVRTYEDIGETVLNLAD